MGKRIFCDKCMQMSICNPNKYPVTKKTIWKATCGCYFKPNELDDIEVKIKYYTNKHGDLTNNLGWNNLAEATKYRIYRDAAKTQLVRELTTFDFTEHQIKLGEYKDYYLVWVNSSNVESTAIKITLP